MVRTFGALLASGDSHLLLLILVTGIYLMLAWISFWIMNERRREGNPVNKIITTCCVVIFLCTGIVRILSNASS
jgi:heme/copper-type cytochrome/quinol oxidase subunit 4